MVHFSAMQVPHLVVAFEDHSLPKQLWTHEAHLAVACWYVFHFPYPTAVEQIKVHIKTYNEAVGTANTEHSGYHETLTVFWMEVVLLYYKKRAVWSSGLEFCNDFINSKYADKGLPFRCLAKDRLMAAPARASMDHAIFGPEWQRLVSEL